MLGVVVAFATVALHSPHGSQLRSDDNLLIIGFKSAPGFF